MAKKFMIFMDDELQPTIVLDDVVLHRHILVPQGTAVRAGGGYWKITGDGVLELSGESTDFGKYDLEMAKEAFQAGRVSLADEVGLEELGIKDLRTG